MGGIMSRNKYPEQTVEKILQISCRLFLEKGYENTTIQDITNELKMSKGAIYHHFRSKDEILDAIGDMQFFERGSFSKVMEDQNLNGLEKLRKVFILELGNYEKQQLDKMMNFVYNPKLLAAMLSQLFEKSAPLLQTIIDEGLADGSITVKDSQSTSEVLMLLINVWLNPMCVPATGADIRRKLQFLREILENLGIPILNDEVYDVVTNYFRNIMDDEI